MPLRMAIDDGAVAAEDVALVGAREPRPAGGRVRRRHGDRRRRRPRARGRRRRLRRARRRRARPGRASPASCPSRAARRCTRSTRARTTSATGASRSPGSGSPGCVPRPTRRRSRGSRPRRSLTGLRDAARVYTGAMSAPGRIDVSIEHKQASRTTRPAASASEHVPRLRLALPRRRARRDPARLPAVRPPLPRAGARADRAAGRRGHASSRRTPTCARPTRSRSST